MVCSAIIACLFASRPLSLHALEHRALSLFTRVSVLTAVDVHVRVSACSAGDIVQIVNTTACPSPNPVFVQRLSYDYQNTFRVSGTG